MATLVQSRVVSTSSVNPPTIAFTSNVAAGNLLVLVEATFGGGEQRFTSVTDSLGQTWTLAPNYQGSTGGVISLWYLLATKAGPLTVTLTPMDHTGISTISMVVAEYSGNPALTSALITSAINTAHNTTPSPGAVAAGSGNLVVGGYCQAATILATAAVAAPLVMRQSVLDGSTKEGIGYADDTASTGTETPTFTLSASVVWSAVGAAFVVGGSQAVLLPPVPVPVPPPTPQPTPAADPALQTSQSGRAVTLVAVAGGKVFVAPAQGTTWTAATNNTGINLITSGVVRSAANNQKLYFADGVSYLLYDPSSNTVSAWAASSGTLPADSGSNTPRLICTWRGRTVLSGLLLDGQNWFMSAVGDPTNWNYFPFPFVVTQAVAGNNSPLGTVGDIITALVPYDDDTLIFGGDHTLWMLRGDPAAGGQIDRISDRIGMAWGIPWDRDPYGNVYFVSNQTGIYSLVPGQAPLRISQPIEQFLVNINTGKNIIRVQWDDSWQGLHVWVTQVAQLAATVHFFWEYRTGAWWTDTFRNQSHNPLCCLTFDGNSPQDRRALIGSFDGYVRMLSRDAVTDDGSPIDSAVLLGPLLTPNLDEVMCKYLQAVLGETSGSVNFAVYVGATAELALASDPIEVGTWTAGRNYNTPVRYAGHAVWVKLSATNYWSMEMVRASVSPLGLVRGRSRG